MSRDFLKFLIRCQVRVCIHNCLSNMKDDCIRWKKDRVIVICLHFEKDSFDLANGFVTCFLTKGPKLPQAVTSTVIFHFITIILNWKVSIFRIFYANDRFVKFLWNKEKKTQNSLRNFFFLSKWCYSTLTHGASLFNNFPPKWPITKAKS